MGFGHYTQGSRHYYPEAPVVGRRTKEDILAGARPVGWTWARKTGHNEVTRRYPARVHPLGCGVDDVVDVVRLHDTDILTVALLADGRVRAIRIDNGGWFTPTTTRHLREALARYGIPGNVWSDTKRRGRPSMVLRLDGQEFRFRRAIIMARDHHGRWTRAN